MTILDLQAMSVPERPAEIAAMLSIEGGDSLVSLLCGGL
jgi:Lanthionine-containing peptide SapB precursor RamS